ncbi:hypothetical protein DFH94DRAFT_183059 [Russula ochroleuca]|uniref:Uncharacterized protein n=1 Tax=Russula ochroleuca TaxID=152965 RepID=A0A9P5N4Q7_9AGAM|nr:hypothetical protein DFH94DRAFT_183059 [Russula ochroleuca]
MSGEQQQNLNEYSYQVVTLSNTVPPVPHDQATMPRDSVNSIYRVSLWCRVLTAGGYSRFTLHWKSPRLHWRPIQLTTNHTVWAMHHTMGQLHLVMALHTFIIAHHVPPNPPCSSTTLYLPSRVAWRLRVPMDHPFSISHSVACLRIRLSLREGARSDPDKISITPVTIVLSRGHQWLASIGILPRASLMTHSQTSS